MDKTTDLRLPWEEETDTAGKVKRRAGSEGMRKREIERQRQRNKNRKSPPRPWSGPSKRAQARSFRTYGVIRLFCNEV
jgi:hypothetical protein